jgi:hypothetical protein
MHQAGPGGGAIGPWLHSKGVHGLYYVIPASRLSGRSPARAGLEKLPGKLRLSQFVTSEQLEVKS